MPNQQLVDYINQCLAVGQTKEQIRQSLLLAGWQEKDIDDALGVVGANVVSLTDFQQPKKFSIKLLVGIILSLIVLVAISGGVYWRQKNAGKKQEEIESTITKNALPEAETVPNASLISDEVIQNIIKISLEYNPNDPNRCDNVARIKIIAPYVEKVLRCEVGKMTDTQKAMLYDAYSVAQKAQEARDGEKDYDRTFLKDVFDALALKYKLEEQEISNIVKFFNPKLVGDNIENNANGCGLTLKQDAKETIKKDLEKEEKVCEQAKMQAKDSSLNNDARTILLTQYKSEKNIASSCIAEDVVEFRVCQFNKMDENDKIKIVNFYKNDPLRPTGSTSLSTTCKPLSDSSCTGTISGSVSEEADVINLLMLKMKMSFPEECELLYKKIPESCSPSIFPFKF